MTRQEYDDAINHPKTYLSKQDTIDDLYEIVKAHMKYSNVNFVINGQQFNISKIIPNKPDINDEKNVFALFLLYNKIIGEAISQNIIGR